MRLTKRVVEALENKGIRYEVRDDVQKGFVVRVGERGNKAFYLVYRAGKGRRAPLKRLHIGSFPSMSVEQARNIAKEKAALIVMGEDPAKTVQDEKSTPFVKDVIELFFDDHGAKIKQSTVRSYRYMSTTFVIPSIGKMKIDAVNFKDIAHLHQSMIKTKYQANRCIALLSKFFNWCEKHGYRVHGSNPASGIEKYPEKKRTLFMGQKELELLGNAFRIMEAQGYTDAETRKTTPLDPIIAAALKMLLFTGARCMEILTLKWEYVDMARGIANLPDSKTGAKTLHLPAPALALLETLPRMSEFCFPGRGGTGHIVNIKDTWGRLLKTAGLTGWRIHDLRHAFASYAACSGKSLPVIGAMLGHTQAATTARYAHLADNPVAQAAEETAALLQRDFSGGKVLPFKKSAG